MKKAIVIYCSFTGNTKKMADHIAGGLREGGCDVTVLSVKDAENVDLLEGYDLACFGVPSINWSIPKPAADYLRKQFNDYIKEYGPIQPCTPVKPNRKALLFCTWSGPHTGMREAVPCMLSMEQYFQHLGFAIVDEWYVLSEFVGNIANSTLGRMGDIRGLPTETELERITQQARNIVVCL